MSAAADALSMSPADREVLQRLAASSTAAHREVIRARVLIDAADGIANTVIATSHGVTAVTVRSWRQAFTKSGLTDWGKVNPAGDAKPLSRKPKSPKSSS